MKKGFAGIIMLFIGIMIAIVIVANVLLPTVFTANQDGWDPGTKAIFNILGIALVAVLLLMIFSGKK